MKVSWLVSWCFKPSQPQKIISGLRGTFIKRYIVERTSKAEIRPAEQSEKAESCRENLWNEVQLKGPQRQKKTQEQNKKEGASSVGLCKNANRNVKVSRRELSCLGSVGVILTLLCWVRQRIESL